MGEFEQSGRQESSVAPIRREWMYQASTTAQAIVCEIAEGQEKAAVGHALLRLDHLAPPATRAEELMLVGLMFQAVIVSLAGSGTLIEMARAHVREMLERCWTPSMSRAERAASLIGMRTDGPIDVTSVARFVGCDVTSLRREFLRQYGMTMREYHGRCRVQQAMRMIGSVNDSIPDVAAAAGYRSLKNFYAAIRVATGLTPLALRRLPAEDLSRLAASLVPCDRRRAERRHAERRGSTLQSTSVVHDRKTSR